MVLSPEKKYWAIGVQTQLDFVNEIGGGGEGGGPIWPHLFLFICKAENVINCTSKKTLSPN